MDKKIIKNYLLPVVLAVLVVALAFGFMQHQKLSGELDDSKRTIDSLQAELESAKEDDRTEIADKINLGVCLDSAMSSYNKSWDEEEKYHGSVDGRLPLDKVNLLDRRHENAKDDCYRQHGVGNE